MRLHKVLIFIFVFCAGVISAQEFDLVITGTESGTQTHTARNSITLGPDYTYTPNGSSMTIDIQNPVVTGAVTYNSTPVDPETRTISTSYLVGATNGSLTVDPIGGASYSIPLELPPGVNGLTPSLSLVYSSNSGQGIVGYGWQLAGLSAISRGPKTVYHDGTPRGIELDTTDRFYLDGQRLVPTNTYPYGNVNALYQTENDVFTRVTPNGTAGNGPAWFTAETKQSLVCEYGNTTGSKQIISGYAHIVNWYVSKISDRFGNMINFAYIKENGFVYPVEITYGPNTVTFYYKEKNDKNCVFLKGVKIEQGLILDKVIIKYNSSVLKTYEFKYNYLGSYNNYYSVLNEVIEYGIGTNRYNSTAISYKLPESVVFSQLANNTTDTYLYYNSKLYSGDFNGDGKEDIFCIPSTGGWRHYRNNGNNTFTLVGSGDFSIDENDIVDLTAIDLNGDNKDDLVFSIGLTSPIFYYAGSYESGSFGSPINFATAWGFFWLYKLDRTSSGDVNGDGLNDCIIVDITTGGIKVYSFAYVNGQMSSMALRSTYDFGPALNETDKVFLSDFNGDGMADIWKLNSDGIKIYSLRGSSLIEIYSNNTPTKDHFLTIGDCNGDGKADMFLYGHINTDWVNWQLCLSNGIGFETNYIPQKKTDLRNDIVRKADFNGDGRADLMVTASSDNGWTGHRYYIANNLGTDFYSYSYSAGQPASSRYLTGDYNGDGRDDYFCTDGASPWTNGYMIYGSPGETQTRMSKIGNGLGFLTKMKYIKLSKAPGSVYQRGTGAIFPVADYQGPISIVDTVEYDNGLGSRNIQKYYYEGLKLHLQGKSLLSYASTRVTDVANGIDNESKFGYNTTYFYPQLLRTISKRTGTTDTISKVTNIWSHIVLSAAKKRIFPYVQNTVQINKLTGHKVTITAGYDNYGNPTSVIKSYNNGITETTTSVYNNNTSSWLLGRPTSTTLQYTGNGNTIIRAGSRTFAATNNNLLTKTWHSGDSVEIRYEYEYNTSGSNTSGSLKKQTTRDVFSNKSRSVQYTYEANKIRVLTVTDPMLHTTTNTYDTYGRLSTQQDYLTTNTVTYGYDNMHRQISVSKNDGSGTTTLYAWQDPASTPLLARYSVQNTGTDGAQTKVWYDKLGRKIRSDLKGFDGTMIFTSTEYNIKGQVYRVSEPYTGTTATWNVFSYDNYSRKTGLTTPSGRNTTWQYTNNSITETVAGKAYTKTYADDGTVLTASDPGGTLSYTYFPDGRVKTITAPGSIVTSMEYDIAGNQRKLTDRSAGEITYTYNGFGELLSQTNDRNQTTTFTYYEDGRPLQKTTVEGTTTYGYNTNEQLTRFGSPGNSRTYGYDTKGRINTVTDTIEGTRFITTFTYDTKGRHKNTTHPSGNTEVNAYNSYGYLSAIGNGSSSLFTILNVNVRGQMTRGRYGSSLEIIKGYNDYGFPMVTSVVSLQNYQYDFNSVTGNLNYRFNAYKGIREDFEYDNLYRLDRVYRNSTTLLDMAYETNKGSITTKSDVGTLNYSLSDKPYALSSISSSTGLIPAVLDTIAYTSFESVNTITEGAYKALFTYNSNNERTKMVVQKNSSDILTRWYLGSKYIKETAGGVTKEYTFIGGDAYTAPVVAVKQGTTTTYYNLLRDHLGSITHVVNASNNTLAAEYSYDAWGRMRNLSTWENYAPGFDTTLMIAGRGFTGHEHLPRFNLINMNGRVYDPLTGQFLSPDNYVQSPDYTQSYNRYVYCLNNPLKYTDPSGEKWWHWVLGEILSGGLVTQTAAYTYTAQIATIPAAQSTASSLDFMFSSTKATYNLFKDIFNPDAHPYGDDSWIFKDLAKSFKIEAGLFLHIPGWETEQTLIGNTAAHFRNLTGNVDNIEFKNWTILVNDEKPDDKRNFGFTLGPYINSQNINRSPGMYEHEYGHTIQSRILGPMYLSKIAIPSGYTSNFRSYEYHNNCWYEIWANNLTKPTSYPTDYRHDDFWYWFKIIAYFSFDN